MFPKAHSGLMVPFQVVAVTASKMPIVKLELQSSWTLQPPMTRPNSPRRQALPNKSRASTELWKERRPGVNAQSSLPVAGFDL